jgi:hypothetical protein
MPDTPNPGPEGNQNFDTAKEVGRAFKRLGELL